MKVLWLSNHWFKKETLKASGGWLVAMAELLLNSEEVELYNITEGKVKDTVRQDVDSLQQWILPVSKINRKGLPSSKIINDIIQIVDDIKPDVIHVWGTEKYWSMLIAQNILTYPSLLDIQGIMNPISKVFYGGLTVKDLYNCIGIKELLKPKKHLYFMHRQSVKRAKAERCVIEHFQNISVQSFWSYAYVRSMNSKCTINRTGIILRQEFYEAKKYQVHSFKNEKPILFTSTAGTIPYKGLHILLEAFALLKVQYPNIQLRIAGGYRKKGIRKSGYERWLEKKITQLGIIESVKWLGNLNAEEIVAELQSANCTIISSFVESYCMALAEAITVGCPCVVSYAGAMPELAQDNVSALFFPMGDYTMCASKIGQILSDEILAQSLSFNAIQKSKHDKHPDAIMSEQVELYNKLLQ